MAARWQQSFVSSLAFLLVALGGAAAEEWKQQRYQTDGFQVEFSGPVDVHEQQLDDATKSRIVRSTTYVQDGGNDYAYIAIAMLVKDNVNFAAAVKAVRDSCKSITTDEPIDVPQGLGRELKGTNCGADAAWRLDGHYFSKGRWFYQVFTFVKMNGTDADNASAHHFVQSFKLIPN